MNTESDKRYTFEEVMEVWKTETPHFDGMGPHRYDDGSKYCAYCLRPKNFKIPKEMV